MGGGVRTVVGQQSWRGTEWLQALGSSCHGLIGLRQPSPSSSHSARVSYDLPNQLRIGVQVKTQKQEVRVGLALTLPARWGVRGHGESPQMSSREPGSRYGLHTY